MPISSKLFLLLLLLVSYTTLVKSASPIKQACSSVLRDSSNTCISKFEDVCAYFSGGQCDSDVCSKLTLNRCTACHDPFVSYYTKGVCQSEKVFCDAANRPQYEDCSNTVFTAACGYYTEDCPFEVCASPYGNPCMACSDSTVLYYKPEECKIEDMVYKCSESMCSLNLDPNKEETYQPVCGIHKECTNAQDCQRQTFDNICQACNNADYPWYQSGICEGEKNFCNTTDTRSSANWGNGPVCAFFNSPIDIPVYTTAENGNNACQDPVVSYFISGTCVPMNNDETYCLPNLRPEVCDDTYEPVCGFTLGKNGSETTHSIISNACNACQNSSIDYYRPGPCIFQCDKNPFLVVECDGSSVYPICGTYTRDGQTYNVSLKSSCFGCYNFEYELDSYTDGLCPGDEGIRCENEGGSFDYVDMFPVCGIFEEGCSNSSCRKTFAEPRFACSYPDIISYNAGLCPGDVGVPCDEYRTSRPPGNNTFWSGEVYQNVCGYNGADCEGESCWRIFNDQYEACVNTTVVSFIKGPCPALEDIEINQN